jgi:iron complex outermembrane receptor protein
MTKNKFIFAVLLLFAGVFLYAQQADTTLTIGGVEVVAEKLLTDERIIIDDNNISKEDVGKILKLNPNINIIRRGNFASDPVIRGFKADQLQLLSNGFMQTNPACPNRMDAPTSHINMEDLEKIEIIKGPYSVRYGMHTGGVVNFVSKSPMVSEEFQLNGQLGYFYHSNGNSSDGNINLQISDKKYFIKIFGGMKNFGNYQSGDGTEILSAFKHNSFGAQAAVFLNKHHQLILDWKQSHAKDVLFAALPMDGDFDDSQIGALKYVYKNEGKKINKVELKTFGNWIDHQMSNKRRPNTKVLNAVSKLQSQTFGGRGELFFQSSEQHQLVFGTDYKMIGKQGNREREVFYNACMDVSFDPPKYFTDAIWQNSEQKDLGFFVESNWHISEKWYWQSGARIDFVSSDIKEPAADFKMLYPELGKSNDLAFMANSRLKFYFEEDISLEWSVGYGQRAPELIERYINHLTVGMDAYEYVGNPMLKMEQNLQNDLRLSVQKTKFQLEATVFYSILNNYIQANLDTTLSRKFMPCMEPKNAKRYENVEDAFIYGFELLTNYNLWKGLNIYGNWAYTLGENVSMDEPLAEIPPMELNAGLKYNANKWNVQFNSRFVMEQDRVSLSFNEQKSSAFQVFDFSAYYTVWKGLSLSLNIENIFDENYVEHLSRAYKNQIPGTNSIYFEPGRNFIVGLSYKL